MPFQLSPGVTVTETTSTAVSPAVATTEGAVAGVFKWGPALERVLVDSEDTLRNIFGEPELSFNTETFHNAANFLAYGNALYVVRTTDASDFNSVSSGSANVTMQVLNSDDYEQNFSNTVGDSSTFHIGRFPGVSGNSLKVSVCDSAAAYSSAAPQDLTIATGGTVATTSDTTGLTIGDFVEVGNNMIGKQTLQIVAVASNVSVTFKTKYTLATNFAGPATRLWEHFDAVDGAPGTTKYVSDRGGLADEIHVVVIDEDGLFTGDIGGILEVWPGLSRATDAKAESGAGNYFKDVLNSGSQYIRSSQLRGGATYANTAANMAASGLAVPLYDSLIAGADSATESTISLASLAAGYDLYRDPTQVDISLILQGKAINNGTADSGLANYITDNIVDVRLDCVAFASPALDDVVNNPGSELTDVSAWSDAVTASDKLVLDSGYKYQYDKYNDAFVYVPLNGDIAGLCARTDLTNDPWWSPAGVNRGRIKNIVKLAWSPKKIASGSLYQKFVNPVVTLPGQGTILSGDKTHIGRENDFDRINIRRLFIVLEKSIARAARASLFEFNDSHTRANFRNLVNPFLKDVQGRRGITDFEVVCDETNNTPQVIDGKEFRGDIYVKPAHAINYIRLKFTSVRTGVEFSEIVGR